MVPAVVFGVGRCDRDWVRGGGGSGCCVGTMFVFMYLSASRHGYGCFEVR